MPKRPGSNGPPASKTRSPFLKKTWILRWNGPIRNSEEREKVYFQGLIDGKHVWTADIRKSQTFATSTAAQQFIYDHLWSGQAKVVRVGPQRHRGLSDRSVPRCLCPKCGRLHKRSQKSSKVMPRANHDFSKTRTKPLSQKPEFEAYGGVGKDPSPPPKDPNT